MNTRGLLLVFSLMFLIPFRALTCPKDSSDIIIPNNILRTKLIPLPAAGTHVEYERRLSDTRGFAIGAGVRYFPDISLASATGTYVPYTLLKGIDITGGILFYSMQDNGWWTIALKAGYRHRERAGFNAEYNGNLARMNMHSEDILGLMRMSFTLSFRFVAMVDFYSVIGLRVSYSEMQYRQYDAATEHIPAIKKEWATLPILNVGLELSFGW